MDVSFAPGDMFAHSSPYYKSAESPKVIQQVYPLYED